MRSNLTVISSDDYEADHMFKTHATQLRGVLNEMWNRQDFNRALRQYNSIVAHFATLAVGPCALREPTEGWGGAIWSHLIAMADWKSHEEALAEARSVRDELLRWPLAISA